MYYNATHLPEPDSRAYPYPLLTYAEAHTQQDFIEAVDEHGGMIIVEWEGKFYVVYNDDYLGGFVIDVDYTAYKKV